MNGRSTRFLLGAATGALVWTSPANAQEGEEARSGSEETIAAEVETEAASAAPTIVVTAQRRNQDLQDVPVTVTVFGTE